MNTKLGMLKQAALAVCFAGGLSVMPLAHADSFGVTYNDSSYYYAPAHPVRCYYDYYGYYRCRPYHSYPEYYYDYDGPYYNPGITFSYYGGFGHRWSHDRDGSRWHHH